MLAAHLNDLQHLHSGDLAVAVQVIHVEGPVQFLLEAAPGGDGQGADELSEVDGAVPILVKGAEGVLGELGGISVGEELQSRTHKLMQGGERVAGPTRAEVSAGKHCADSTAGAPPPLHAAGGGVRLACLDSGWPGRCSRPRAGTRRPSRRVCRDTRLFPGGEAGDMRPLCWRGLEAGH